MHAQEGKQDALDCAHCDAERRGLLRSRIARLAEESLPDSSTGRLKEAIDKAPPCDDYAYHNGYGR